MIVPQCRDVIRYCISSDNSCACKVKISDDIAVPPVVHDKCDVSLLDVSVACELKDSALECALSDCGGEKFKCDCNVYEFV